jgi:glycerol-3-phosphate dehydrogenase subunit C
LINSVDTSLDKCIKCNICTTACPVSGVTDLFPGPKYAAPQASRFRRENQPSPDKSVDYCSGCRVCNMVCPTGVKIAEINARARAVLISQGKINPVLRIRNNIIARAGLIGKIAHTLAPIANPLMNMHTIRQFGEIFFGLALKAPLPNFSQHTFTSWYKRHPRPKNQFRKVIYFHGCSTEYYEPRIGRSAIQVLEANGFEVIVPRQNCCGLPLLSNGEFSSAKKYHKTNVKYLVEYARLGLPIVGTSTSCTLTLKEEAPELLDMFDEDTRLVAENTWDLNEYLLKLYAEGSLNLDLRQIPAQLPYHIPCQYNAHRIGKPGLDLLRLIPGLSIIESQAPCCGIAGTYGYKKEKYQIAMQVGAPLFQFIKKSQSPMVICDSETCRWQITHATYIPSIHPIELLAAAYGLIVEPPLKDYIEKLF